MKLVSHKYIGKYIAWTQGLILKSALLRGENSFLEDSGRKTLLQLTSQAPDVATSSRCIRNGELKGNNKE
jgi:hypothetical protein